MFFRHEPSHVLPSATSCRCHRWLAAPLALLLLINLPAPLVQAASLTVNSLTDTDNGSDGLCTLREALTAVNNNSDYHECASTAYGNDTITFSVSGTITLSASLPSISDGSGLTIDGGSVVTISGNNAVRVLQVDSGARLTLQNLVVANGTTSLLSGGLYNSGTATINNSSFSNNRGSDGGSIFNASGATATISNSSFSGNSATNAGGAVSSSGTLTITNSTISSNSASSGGGITSFGGTVTINSSTISGNNASALAGGLMNGGGTVIVTNSTISGNTASSGGAIYNGSGSTVTVTNSTISGNTAGGTFGGGLYNNGGTATISNGTISGNTASSGGAIFNGSGSTTAVWNSTISANSAATAGGINNFSGTLTVTNSIIANSLLGGNCAGTITDGGHNLDSFTTCGWGSSKGSLSNTDPRLGPLADNGGPTQTHALLADSPAINAGDNSLIPADVTDQDEDGHTSEPLPFDQRGASFLRTIGRTVDIGAFEFGVRVALPMVIR